MFRGQELTIAEEHVAGVQSTGDAVEPSALRVIAHRNLGGTERLHGLGGELNIAEKVDLREFSEADFLFYLVTIAHLNHVARLADSKALRVQIEGPKVIARRH